MAEKKDVAKKSIKKVLSKKSTVPSKKITKGTKYTCNVCGLIVSIDRECGCIETCDIICCGKQMVQKK